MNSVFLLNALDNILFGAGNWDITNLLRNSTTTAQGWGGLLLGLVGTVCALWGAIRIGYGLMSDRAQVSYGKMGMLVLLGGFFIFGGWQSLSSIAKGGQKTINDLGTGRGGVIGLWDYAVELSKLPLF